MEGQEMQRAASPFATACESLRYCLRKPSQLPAFFDATGSVISDGQKGLFT
jgi:hypothetical protein